MTNSRDIAGVVAKPPLIYGGALLFGGVAGRLLPVLAWPPDWPTEGTLIAGLLLLAIGILLLAAGVLQFKRHGTPVPTDRPTTALVTTGVLPSPAIRFTSPWRRSIWASGSSCRACPCWS